MALEILRTLDSSVACRECAAQVRPRARSSPAAPGGAGLLAFLSAACTWHWTHVQVALSTDVVQLNDSGSVGGLFVNPQSFVHDVITFSGVNQHSLMTESEPTAEDSWFPGYCWQCGGRRTHAAHACAWAVPRSNVPAACSGWARVAT